ncbi:MAG: alkaline phosphatase D family protein [Verrucomicrobiales bacterium]
MRVSFFTFCVLPFLAGVSCAGDEFGDQFDEAVLREIAVGSCHRTGPKSEEAFACVVRAKPDAFLFLGDNIYGDTRDMKVLQEKYAALDAVTSWKQLRQSTRVLGTWDDHDYGENDAGVEYPAKVESAKVQKDFFAIPADHPMRKREGVYQSAIFGPQGKRTQILLLDTRYFRSPLRQEKIDGRKAYLPDPDPAKTFLGEAQWKWLDTQLAQPADVRIIGSSIQILPEEHRFEKWANFPLEREKLLNKLAAAKGRLVLLSGDRHFAEISRQTVGETQLVEMTTSGMTHTGGGKIGETNRHRVGEPVSSLNWGVVSIEWKENAAPGLKLEVRNTEGKVTASHSW